MAKLSRDKGNRWEREVARRFRETMPGETIRRGIQSRDGTSEVADVDMPCFFVECKKGKRPVIDRAWKQAAGAAPCHKWPIAVTMADRQTALVTISLEDFLDLVGEWWTTRNWLR